MTEPDGAWFAPKRYGYGAGLPTRWQGWALLGGYLALVLAVATAMEEHPALVIALVLPATVLFIVIATRRTRGGWRWRWGE